MGTHIAPWKRRRRLSYGAAGAKSLLLVVLLLCPFLAQVSASIFTFGQKRFSYEGLIDAGSMGLEDVDGQVAAFGDLNGDSAMDLFVVSGDATRVSVYLWDHDSFSFQVSPSSEVVVPNGRKIVNIIPADFTYDGKLDLLVMLQGNQETEMMLWLGNVGGGFESPPLTIPAASSVQPFTLDATGDMHIDLIGYASATKDKLSIWKNTYDETNGTQPFQVVTAPFHYDKTTSAEPACQLSEPHSSAFIDLDGDCLADIFLVCKGSTAWKLTYQIWIAEKVVKGSTPMYKFARGGDLPPGSGALSFADMDRDGTIDVVFPSCEGSTCYINIAYNKQMPLCSEKRSGWFGVGPGEDKKGGGLVGGDCRDPESNLCVADANFTFDFTVSKDNDLLTRIAVADIVPEAGLLMSDDMLSQPIQLPLALGDHNKDGYPDMALITLPSQRQDKTRLRLLESVACKLKGPAPPGCPADEGKRGGKRTFEMMRRNTFAIGTFTDVRSVSFFDLAEDGSLDLLLQRLPPSNASPHSQDNRVITFIQNNFFYDAFMLKVLTSNGACSSYCDKGSAHYKPWGVNYGGASYKFTVLDTNGVRRAQQVGQLAQTAYRALLTPYSYFGLGRTNNYVEALFIGTTKRRENNFVEMEGVIPNSQVIVLPWEQGGNGDPSTWKKELYLKPGDWIPWVMVVLATIIVILLGFVFVLHLNEKREDELERKRAVHAINFDAL